MSERGACGLARRAERQHVRTRVPGRCEVKGEVGALPRQGRAGARAARAAAPWQLKPAAPLALPLQLPFWSPVFTLPLLLPLVLPVLTLPASARAVALSLAACGPLPASSLGRWIGGIAGIAA